MSDGAASPSHPDKYPSDRCPLCGNDNRCAVVAKGPDACSDCWCKSVEIPQEVLACLPERARNVACICSTCATRPAPTTTADVHHVVDQGQRPAVQLEANGQRVLIAQTGAQVLSWHTEDGDILWTASEPKYEPGKPVRGGVPVVFPWFGDHKTDPALPPHGFARSAAWQCVAEGPAQVTLRLTDSAATRAVWDHAFAVELTVTLTDALAIRMTVCNTGDAPFSFEQALHTYFAAGDIHEASVHGLENVRYVEHAREPEDSWDPGQPIRFRAETDRVFQDVPDELTLHARSLGRRVTLATKNSRSTIVWNPWPNKTARLSQMRADDWQHFCCVESANAFENAIELAGGQRHEMTLTLRVARD